MPEKLTVLIPCKNESRNIRDCIESVRPVADEILVADSLSTDDTLEVVRRLGGCRIIQREFVDYANFKNWAIPQAAHPWVLIVDADERVTQTLATEIRAVLARDDPSRDAYRMGRDNFFLGRLMRHCGLNRTTHIHLIRREVCRYIPAARVHERFDVSPQRVGALRGKLLHYTGASIPEWMEKQSRYATTQAEDRYAAGRRTSWPALFVFPFARFFQLYFLRGGFFDGTTGLIYCMSSMLYTFQKYAVLWQLGRNWRDRADPVRNQ